MSIGQGTCRRCACEPSSVSHLTLSQTTCLHSQSRSMWLLLLAPMKRLMQSNVCEDPASALFSPQETLRPTCLSTDRSSRTSGISVLRLRLSITRRSTGQWVCFEACLVPRKLAAKDLRSHSWSDIRPWPLKLYKARTCVHVLKSFSPTALFSNGRQGTNLLHDVNKFPQVALQ